MVSNTSFIAVKTLGSISHTVYGSTRKWKKLWENNRQLIKDPNKIYAGFYLYYQPEGNLTNEPAAVEGTAAIQPAPVQQNPNPVMPRSPRIKIKKLKIRNSIMGRSLLILDLPMNHLKDRNFNPDSLEGEYNLAEMWATFRSARLRAGAMAGIFAGVMMQIFGMIYNAVVGDDLLKGMKISALPLVGNSALAYGVGPGLWVGLIMFFALAIVLGMAYAHFTGVNNKKGLFGIGLTWAAFSWVFITCLFSPSFRSYHEADIPRGVMFFAWIVFGLSLMSVAWFDKQGYIAKKK